MMAGLSTVVLAQAGESGSTDSWHFSRPPATESAAHTDSMYVFLWWFGAAWFGFLMFLMVYWVIKYRRRPGKIAQASTAHNTPLEIMWTIIPTLMLVYIFFRGFNGYIEKMIAPGDAMELRVIASMWNWSIFYPNGAETPATTRFSVNEKAGISGAKEFPVFYVPADKAIRLRMSSNDVVHSFYVPDFRVKQDVVPNRYTSLWFQPKAPGENAKKLPMVDPNSAEAKKDPWKVAVAGVPYVDHYLFCAEYCGDEHSEMAGIIRVVPEDAWNRWVAAITQVGGTPEEVGERIWKTRCASCHTIDGGNNTGPTWKDLYGHPVAFAGGASLSAEQMADPVQFASYVRESVLNPSAKIVKGFESQNMPSFQGLLNDAQIDAVIAFMKSPKVSPNAPK